MFPMAVILLMMCIGETAATRAMSKSAVQDDAIVAKAGDAGSSSWTWSDSSVSELSDSSIKSLLSLQFSEPLPTVMSRAQKTSESMDVAKALRHLGQNVPQEVRSLAHGDVSFVQGSKKPTGAGMYKEGLKGVFERAMGFLSHEIDLVREALDIKLFECGFFKLEKEAEIVEIGDRLSEISQDMSLTAAVIGRTTMQKERLMNMIKEKEEALREHVDVCKTTRSTLVEERAVIQQDMKMIKTIVNVVVSECEKSKGAALMIQACALGRGGETFFKTGNSEIQRMASGFKSSEAQKRFQRVLFEVYGGAGAMLPGGLPLSVLKDSEGDTSDDDVGDMLSDRRSFAQTAKQLQRVIGSTDIHAHAGPVGAQAKPSADDAGERCQLDQANCAPLLDKLSEMKSQITDDLEEKTRELTQHDEECRAVEEILNKEIKTYLDSVNVQNVELAKATAQMSQLQIQQTDELKLKQLSCTALRTKYQECYKELTKLEEEICAYLKVRFQVYLTVKYPKFKPGDEVVPIRDCEVTDWVVGGCSQTCQDPRGLPGVRLITRQMADPTWTNNTDETKYAAKCPPLETRQECARNPCPVDCEVGDWSGWAECSKNCGGGQQGRSRELLKMAENGGMACPETTEETTCNTGACDQDCQLSDWSEWSSCSRVCRWSPEARPGIQYRQKGILVAVKGAGECPRPDTQDRYNDRFCNTDPCPQSMVCVANMDVVIVLDGSGSLFHAYPPYDKNFQIMKEFSEALINDAKLATVDEGGYPSHGMRFGVVLFSWSPQKVVHITHDKDELLSKIKSMKWPRGWTYTGRALMLARDMFRLATTPDALSRKQVVLLVTDGRASNKVNAAKAAKELKESGVRLILVPVKNANDRNVEAEMCTWATQPCKENMLGTPRFPELMSKLNRYLTTMCPQLEAKAETIPHVL